MSQDLATIKYRLSWFGPQADSWGQMGGDCRTLADAIRGCLSVPNQEPKFAKVYEAYQHLLDVFSQSTDSQTGVGYGVAAQVSAAIKERLLETSYAYAAAESQGTDWAAEVARLIEADKEARR